MGKLSERLFNIGKEFETNAGLEDVSTAALEAAELLDECERALASLTAWKWPVEITAPELGGLLNAMAHANVTLNKLRSQEKAD